MSRWLSAVVLSATLGACAALEADPNPPGPLPHGGTGEFRPLSADESGVRGTPTGRALPVRDAFDSGSVAGGHLFYAAAVLPDMAPDPVTDPVPGEVIWTDFEPRRIFRSEPQELPGYFIGTEVFAATQAWQGEAVFHPWAVVTDGGALLYYATEAGIGVAEASAVTGAFSPVGDGPVLGPGTGGVLPTRPSAIVHPDGRVLVYFEAGGTIGLATSTDGRTLTRVTDALALGPDPIDDGSRELQVGAPGAVVATTEAGRSVVRLYFESRRDDGRRIMMLAASEDGERFERFSRPVLGEEDRRFPAAVQVDSRTTLLYVTAPRTQAGREVNALVVTVAPRSVRFAPEE